MFVVNFTSSTGKLSEKRFWVDTTSHKWHARAMNSVEHWHYWLTHCIKWIILQRGHKTTPMRQNGSLTDREWKGCFFFFSFIYFIYTIFFTTHLNDKRYFNFIIILKRHTEKGEKVIQFTSDHRTQLHPSVILKTTCSFQLPFAFAKPHIFTMKVLCCIKSHKLSL